MRSRDKMKVAAKPFDKYGGKHWVKVDFKTTSWVPSFEDLFRIIQAICHCEDEKYPNGKGRQMVREFLWDACETPGDGHSLNELWMGLKAEYKIPNRD